MARTNERFIEAHNKMIAVCKRMEIGDELPSENAMASTLGVSRTVVRSILERFKDQALISINARQKLLMRRPTKDDLLETRATLLGIEELESQFLEWVLRMDVPAGEVLNVAQLSQHFSVAPHTLQEFLSSLSRFGIVERRARGGWVLHGFTLDYAIELSDFRNLLELNAVKQLIALPEDHDIWNQLEVLEQEHLDLLQSIETAYHDFSKLDEKFHMAINSIVNNRFVAEFQKVISLVFHYHFQWNKADEKLRNTAAIGEHLEYIRALRSRDLAAATQAAQNHLSTSKRTLVNSLKTNGHTD
ncbi:MAG: GntR family transcriptional regulator [Pacificibacter sp.]|uniref:GntR family transcriptional regulator n=1 Tax=Pacificibacter sp. TaxID=1917866 RepID=UPI00321AC2A4